MSLLLAAKIGRFAEEMTLAPSATKCTAFAPNPIHKQHRGSARSPNWSDSWLHALLEDERSGRFPQRQPEHAPGVGAQVRLPEAGTLHRQAPPVHPRGDRGSEGRASRGTLDFIRDQPG